MSKIYIYGRVSTEQQSLEQQERTISEYLKRYNLTADEVVADEGISGGVTYKDRNLGKILLPKLKAGDTLIVSEISRLGRSMFDLAKLIHEELKPRGVRLIIVGMGIDLRCGEMRPIDNLILNNFAFAAELEKSLIQSRTKSSLAVKKQQGIKLGAANEKYQQSMAAKTPEERKIIAVKKGISRNQRFMGCTETRTFIKILCRVFPEVCVNDDPTTWTDWKSINTKGENKYRVLALMRDFKELDAAGGVFADWDFSDLQSKALQIRLASKIQTLRRAVLFKLSANKYCREQIICN